MTQQRREVRQLLINPKFQLTVVAYTLLVAGFVAGILFGANYFLSSTFAERGKTLDLPEDHIYFRFLAEQQELMMIVLAATVSVSFIVIVIGGLILSHRVAGPVHRLRTHMDRLASGEDLGSFNFREKDFFPELAESFNKVLNSLKK